MLFAIQDDALKASEVDITVERDDQGAPVWVTYDTVVNLTEIESLEKRDDTDTPVAKKGRLKKATSK